MNRAKDHQDLQNLRQEGSKQTKIDMIKTKIIKKIKLSQNKAKTNEQT